MNLASCSLYPEFDRSLNYTETQPTPQDTVFVGVDLNVGNCVTQHLVRRGDEFHFFAERVYRDTQQIAQGLKEMYPEHFGGASWCSFLMQPQSNGRLQQRRSQTWGS